ncbi:p23 cell envelope protein [Borrelia sp. P9F1]|uniref:BB0158 famile outer surface lipoprotein n=1 Tax=Borrelia sp. P9F1 TaxID=3058374 RepID=UPI002649DA50|nr:p23 cell envelope protein [Borrelia sp. P9F1]WKC58675.1 p23 cell envelope protein [Borrelia sp. P9F1]
MKNLGNLFLTLIVALFVACDLRAIKFFYTTIGQKSESPMPSNSVAILSLKKNKEAEQSDSLVANSPKQEVEEKYETLEGSKKVTALAFISSNVTWIKTKAVGIKAADGKPIPELESKIRYSYSISPVKLNGQFTKYTMPLVLFEVTDGNGNLEVESFTLEDDPSLDFNKRKHSEQSSFFFSIPLSIPTKEISSEEGYLNSNPFGVLCGNDKTIPALTKLQNVKAKIKVKDSTTGSITEYNISLNSSYLTRLIEEVMKKNPGIEKLAPDFKLYNQ